MSYSKQIPSGTTIMFGGESPPKGWFVCDGRELNTADYPSLFQVLGFKWGGNGTTKFNIPDMRGLFVRGLDGVLNRDPDKATRTFIKPGGSTGNNIGSLQLSHFGSHSHAGSSVNSSSYDLGHSHGNTDQFSSTHKHSGYVKENHSHSHKFTIVTQFTIGPWTRNGTLNYWDQLRQYTLDPADVTASPLGDHSSVVNAAKDDHDHGVDPRAPSHSHTVTVTVNDYTGSAETRPKNVYVNYIIKI